GASDTGASPFNGTIDEVKIYNYTLSAGQIYQNYKAGLNNKTASVITLESTALGEQWFCSVTPNDGYSDGQTKNSTSVTISASNTAPTKVNLSTPTAGNTTIHRRNTRFTWDAAFDSDGDPLNYTLNITSGYCSDLYYGNISDLNFTAQSELCLDNMYFWQVRAYDGTEYGQWSARWNFTIEPTVILNLTTSRVNFGNLAPGAITDTDNNASPLVVQNDGNIRMNISYVSAASSLFSTIGLNTLYFMFKVDNDTTEANSFNWTISQTSWTNITSILTQNKSAIGQLKYQDSQDTAEIDIKVTVPPHESPGSKNAIVYIIGESP
ncbi:MAG: LamG domain-containing protein, partial [Candidatus Woesearchaeota archaeon]|nr:LamG domain-containing protein [Candidatus Woesearchaeota archaeon]